MSELIRNPIHSLLASVAAVAAVVVLAVLAFIRVGQYFDLEHAKLRTAAVDNCFKAAVIETNRKIETEEKELRVVEPVRDVYVYCLKDKGFEPTQQ